MVEDLPVDARARHEVVHPVQAADEGALAAARRADDRRDAGCGRSPCVTPVDRRVAPVVDGEVLDVEDGLALHGRSIIAPLGDLDRRHVDDGPARRLGRVFVHVLLLGIQRASFLRLRASSGACDQACDQDERHQHERGRPRLLVIRRVGRLGVLEDQHRDVRQRLRRVRRDEGGEDRGREQERRRLARGARDREHGRRSGSRRASVGRITPSTVRQRCAPSARPASRSVDGHEQQDLLRRARDERQHDHREREGAGVAALLVPDDEQPEDEHADHDRGQAVEHVEHEADRRATRFDANSVR